MASKLSKLKADIRAINKAIDDNLRVEAKRDVFMGMHDAIVDPMYPNITAQSCIKGYRRRAIHHRKVTQHMIKQLHEMQRELIKANAR